MTTQLDALIAAALAARDDEDAALVLADYLLDRGDPRGELIHVQCMMARLTTDAEKIAELVPHEQALLAKRSPPRGTQVRYWRGYAYAEVEAYYGHLAVGYLVNELLIARLVITGCSGGAGRWDNASRLIEATMHRVRELELRDLVWYWHDSDWEDTGRQDVEEIDETPQCAKLFAALPPRPPTLTKVTAEGVALPADWRT